MKRVLLLVCMLCHVAFMITAEEGDRYSRHALMQLVVSDPDSVLTILDEAEEVKPASLPQYSIDLCRGIAYNEKREVGLMDYYVKKALESDSMNTNQRARLTALCLLSRSQKYFGNIQNSITTADEAIRLARDLGDRDSENDMLIAITEIYFDMGDDKQGYDFLDKIIDRASTVEEASELAMISFAYGVKMTRLATQGRYDEALKAGEERLALINGLEGEAGIPEGYVDQQRGYTYAKIASTAEAAGKTDVAVDAYRKFMSTKFGNSEVGRVYIVSYLLYSHQWDKVLEFTKPLYKVFEGTDSINLDYLDLLESNAEAYCGLGDYRKGYDLLDRATAIRDSIMEREKDEKAREFAMLFSINEHNLELEKSKEKVRRKHVVMVASICVSVFVVIILVILILRYKSELRHNRVIIKQIDEIKQQRGLILRDENQEGDTRNKEDYLEFLRMEQTIMTKKLFTHSDVNRDTIAEVCGMPRTKVIRLINNYVGLTPNEYINKLRVEYSIILMDEHPNWTIDAISEAAGYVRRATFYNHFNNIYGMTPASYRRNRRGV